MRSFLRNRVGDPEKRKAQRDRAFVTADSIGVPRRFLLDRAEVQISEQVASGSFGTVSHCTESYSALDHSPLF